MPGPTSSLFTELKRRNVFRVAAAYAVVGWLLVQASDVVLPRLGLPEWTVTFVIVMVFLGFPLALFLAWAYELTPEGVRRSAGVHPEESVGPKAGRTLDWLILAGLALVVTVVLADRFWLDAEPVATELVEPGLEARPEVPAKPLMVTDRSIAVLPFADLSAAGDQEYFADGIAEELLLALSRVRDLRVAGRSSSFYFRGRSEDLRTIGETLNVAYILEGSVRKSADRLRITAQLISTEDGFHLWSDTYDGELGDIFELQEKIARAITSELEVVLTGEQQEQIVEVATEDTEAYELFLQATAIFNRRDRDRLVRARELLEEALRLDPEFARARSRLAAVLVVTPAYASVDKASFEAEAERQARIAARQDDRLAEPHAVLGVLFFVAREYSAAHAEFLRALERDPVDITSNFWFGMNSWMAGYRGQAVRYLDKVLAIDPMMPIALIWRAYGYLDQGDLESARRLNQRAYDLGLIAAVHGLSMVAGLEGDRDLAMRLNSRMLREAFAIPLDESAVQALSRGVYGGPEDQERAAAVIEEYLASGPEPVHGLIPYLLMRIGRPGQALELAASAPMISEPVFYVSLWIRSIGDAARRSPGFPEFARLTGLADYWEQFGPPDGCHRQADRDFVCE